MRRSCSERAVRGRTALALVLLAALTAAGCGTLSVSEERRLGAEAERQVRAEAVLLNDRVVNEYVSRIGERLLAVAPPEPFDIRFSVIENDEINAFALPGGHIYVHTGTILKARNVSELAGVIAHEIGHVVKRHVAENYNRQRAASLGHQVLVLGTGILIGPQAAGAVNLGSGLAMLAVVNSFTREAEREADQFALRILPQAGYDPAGMITFFETLRREGGPHIPKFLSSHPTTDERIAAARRELAALDLPPGLRRDDSGRLEIIQRRIRLLTGRVRPAGVHAGR